MTPIPKAPVEEAGQGLVVHLEVISLRARTLSPDAPDEIERIFADHEAACADHAHQEAHHNSGQDTAFRFR